ncbi:MAG: GtrA family protein [Lachnospiraceae bacterium]|jgi:putative flippase GtrA|nr:GtrA family protein [Lachnospiraceae bacterium]SDA73847.1 Putative flippase GtrA (transmembrane translocase of bactoprenol-linked glucose) [Lachnospiraceae bacterium G11]
MKKLFDFCKTMYKKYEELVNYFVVGVATTVVYFLACLFFKIFWDPNIPFQNALINFWGWVVGVIFAYFTNRAFVFKSKDPHMWTEFFKFTLGRVATLLLDLFIMWLFVNAMDWGHWTYKGFDAGYWLAKFISCVLVMIANYVISKLVVFTGKDKNKEVTNEEADA